MPDTHDDRRRFHRVATDKPVELTIGDRSYSGTVLDISLRGLLFLSTADAQPQHGDQAKAHIKLDDELCCIDLVGEVAHVQGRRIGMHCTSMDLDSAAKLRRMVELNLADNALLERELTQLIAGDKGNSD